MLINCEGPFIRKVVEKVWPQFYEKVYIPLLSYRDDRRYGPFVDAHVEKLRSQKPFPLFTKIEIETINRCNYTCSFCPVNKLVDTRPFKLMDKSLFLSIIDQLKDLEYSDEISLFSNNEPLLDNRLVEFHKITREALPKAELYLFTNGSLLTVDKFLELMQYLDYMVIDNYHDKLKLIKPVRKIYEYCSKNRVYEDKVRIYVRRRTEYRETRAGQAKNRTRIRTPKSSCVLPFNQMIVRPDGKLSLCCNDALGKMTLGDLTKEKISDVWNNDSYWSARNTLLKQGRKGQSLSIGCDHLHRIRRPRPQEPATEVIDADLRGYFDAIPHHELVKSAPRVSDGTNPRG